MTVAVAQCEATQIVHQSDSLPNLIGQRLIVLHQPVNLINQSLVILARHLIALLFEPLNGVVVTNLLAATRWRKRH